MSIKLNSVGGGSVTIQEPNTASDFTLSVPAVTANILTNRTAGTVLQVVHGTFATGSTTTSTSFVDTGLSASITPTSTSNRILVIVNLNGCLTLNGGAAMLVDLLRGSSSICKFGEAGLNGTSNRNDFGDFAVSFLDSPSTTSSTTYKVQARSSNGASVYWCNQTNNSVSTITLMEIAA